MRGDPISRSLNKNIRREIRSTLGRFIAIFAISALGAGFFAGLKATSPDMQATADLYYETQHLADWRLVSTFGFTQNDVDALRAQDGVGEVMAGYSFDLLVEGAADVEVAHISALPKDTGENAPGYLNRPVLESGRMPTAPGECLMDSFSTHSIGDVITVSAQNDQDTLDLLALREFTVVGTATSPAYVSFQRGNTNIGNGRVDFFLYVMPGAFDSDYYTELLVRAEERPFSFSDSYDQMVADGTNQLESFGETRAEIRYNEITGDAQAELNDARTELADAQAELDDALQQLNDAEQQLADGWAEYNEGTRQLADAQDDYLLAETALTASLITLQDAQAQYDAAAAQYNNGLAQWQDASAQVALLNTGYTAIPAALGGMATLLPAVTAPTPDPAMVQQYTEAATAVTTTVYGFATLLSEAGQDAVAGVFSALAADAQTALGQGRWQDAYNTLNSVNSPIIAGLTPMAVMQNALSTAQTQLNDAKAALNAAYAQLDTASVQLAQGWAAYDAGVQGLADAQAEMADAKAQLADALVTLNNSQAELADGWTEYEDGLTEFEEKRAEADTELAEAQTKIDEAQAELDDLGSPEWYVFTRDDYVGYSGFASDTLRIDAIVVVIPVFFFLVAALVCLTTMTRMVEEQRGLIGTLKALGYSKFSIALKYVTYAGIASVGGAVFGMVVGIIVFPTAIWNAYRIMYLMPALQLGNNLMDGIVIVILCVAVTTFSTLAACMGALHSAPAGLMRPKAPRAGKRVLLERIGPLWRRMSFMAKVTARNLFRYKKRFFMTVVGVAGCTALLVTGFGLSDSITGLVARQYGAINTYDITVALTEPSTSGEDTALNQVLPEYGQALYISETQIDVKSDSGSGSGSGMTTYLAVPEDAQSLTDFITFRERVSQDTVPFPQDGAVITEKLATKLNVGAGDTISINRANEIPVELTVAGVIENYIYNYVYITPAQYQTLFGEAPEYRNVLLSYPDGAAYDSDEVLAALVGAKPAAGAVDIASLTDQFNDMMGSLNAVVWLIIIAAGLLAFVVLYNLTNINITERGREIATLKVLGFYNGEVAMYVYRENLILTLIGAAFGLVLGVFLHSFVITTAEVDEVMFGRVVEPMSYVWSVLFTLLCAMLVNLVMLKRLRRVDMVESLKAGE